MSLSEETALLRIKRMEASLIRSYLTHSDVLRRADYELVRYALVLARLRAFSPGAAGTRLAHRQARAEVTLNTSPVATLRKLLLDTLYAPLREQRNILLRLSQVRQHVPQVRAATAQARRELLATHAHDFNAAELDAELCHKVLVLAPGGGGGSGFVYIGLVARLKAEGLLPSYIVGASIGALLGGLMARDAEPDIEALMAWGKGLRVRQIFSRPTTAGVLSLPGAVRLHLRGMDQMLCHPDGSPLRIKDLAIPYDALIAGVKLSAYRDLPALPARRSHMLGAPMVVAERMLQLISYFSPHVAQGIVLGRDERTREMRVVDAIGLSSAIPGVLQYAPWRDDVKSLSILSDLRKTHQLRAFMDGGTVANVPARAAWKGVQSGRIGTRNAFYLALDCFHPQWSAGHAWLVPVTQAIQAQLPAQRPYYDWLVRFQPTPSPVNLLPSPTVFDKAFQWGWDQAESLLPQLHEALRPLQVPDFN
ncbi:patatin-like phospholipase [Paraperlucidibaca baekdonensis]|uniref:Patatin-like phospholipase n=1 Tax=Paraperlucidibaca baekdonensis TaxID=748120 RepID=A0A3E0H8C3_9GAMM|nr:patatin-like phospholipase family protein [Paraperlucidibaca baekdonensis]REH39884.1 patatin-like phospholipase [Paraperlucidibaca baekdonensis]